MISLTERPIDPEAILAAVASHEAGAVVLFLGTTRELTHGRIQHGFEYLDAGKRDRPTSYYGPNSGVALALDALPKPRRVAIVGLGAGTLAAWGSPGDVFRFYEINPDVETIARKWFFFLNDSKARTEIVLGDARVQLERCPNRTQFIIVVSGRHTEQRDNLLADRLIHDAAVPSHGPLIALAVGSAHFLSGLNLGNSVAPLSRVP